MHNIYFYERMDVLKNLLNISDRREMIIWQAM